MKNRLVAVALAVMVAGTLTACSSGSKTAETQAPKETQATTQAPETQAPETQAPETQAPETQAPETQAPETQAAETQAPETEAVAAAVEETEAAVAETEAKEAVAETEAEAAETEAKEAVAETEAEAAETEAKEAAAETEAEAAETEAKEAAAETEAEAAETEAKEAAAETEAEAAETEAKEAVAETEAEAAETEAKEAVAETEAEAAETEAKEAAAETEAEAAETEAKEAVAETEAEAAETEEEMDDKAVYTIYNQTGEAVTSIKLYDNQKKKMLVSDSEPLAAGESRDITIEKYDGLTPDTTYAFSFQTESGYVAVYKKLHYETVPMTLISEDAKTGPIPFQFAEPEVSETEAETEAAVLAAETEAEDAAAAETEAETEAERELPEKAEYKLDNATGEKITGIKVTDNDSKKEVFSLDKELEDGDSVEFTIDKDDTITGDTSYTLEFTTESKYTGKFETLHFEVAEISLIAEDAKTGATEIKFVPDWAGIEAETEAETEA